MHIQPLFMHIYSLIVSLRVQDDIVSSLRMSPDHLFKVVHPFNRPNLFYEVSPSLRHTAFVFLRFVLSQVRYQPFLPTAEKQYINILEYITGLASRRGSGSCGIVYARTRKTCDELAEFLRRRGIQARPYHRGIAAQRLDTTLREWSEGDRCDVVVATVCFGMGIDKADVR